jgi:hypothetical protein
MDHKKSTGKGRKKKVNPIKRSSVIMLFTIKLISLSREPAVLANQPRELAVPTNLDQLRNQQGTWTHQ